MNPDEIEIDFSANPVEEPANQGWPNGDVRCIFSINTGRCGSDYLARLFSQIPQCLAFHEPAPAGHGETLQQYSQGSTGLAMEVAKQKAIAVADANEAGLTYIETNHCFIKSFGWLMPTLLEESEIGIIVLKRDREKVINSLMRVHCRPLSWLGQQWILTPDKQNPLVPPPSTTLGPALTYRLFRLVDSRLNRFQNLLWRLTKFSDRDRYERACIGWYYDETYAAAAKFQQDFRQVRIYETTTDELNQPDKVEQMVNHFGLSVSPSLLNLVGTPTNLKRMH